MRKLVTLCVIHRCTSQGPFTSKSGTVRFSHTHTHTHTQTYTHTDPAVHSIGFSLPVYSERKGKEERRRKKGRRKSIHTHCLGLCVNAGSKSGRKGELAKVHAGCTGTGHKEDRKKSRHTNCSSELCEKQAKKERRGRKRERVK